MYTTFLRKHLDPILGISKFRKLGCPISLMPHNLLIYTYLLDPVPILHCFSINTYPENKFIKLLIANKSFLDFNELLIGLRLIL